MVADAHLYEKNIQKRKGSFKTTKTPKFYMKCCILKDS